MGTEGPSPGSGSYRRVSSLLRLLQWKDSYRCPVSDSIVAVHGLNGQRERTWTAESNNVLWLRDLLPQKIKNARILTWGYDARTHTKSHTDFLSTKKLYDHGRELVYDLWAERRETDTSQRPIIFVAHSLGGIVVKDVSQDVLPMSTAHLLASTWH